MADRLGSRNIPRYAERGLRRFSLLRAARTHTKAQVGRTNCARRSGARKPSPDHHASASGCASSGLTTISNIAARYRGMRTSRSSSGNRDGHLQASILIRSMFQFGCGDAARLLLKRMQHVPRGRSSGKA